MVSLGVFLFLVHFDAFFVVGFLFQFLALSLLFFAC